MAEYELGMALREAYNNAKNEMKSQCRYIYLALSMVKEYWQIIIISRR